MNIIVFEDKYTGLLNPYCINHASFEIKTGIYSNLDRIKSIYASHKIFLIVRDDLKDLIKEKFPDFTINPSIIPKGLYLNGSVVWNQSFFEKNKLEDIGCFENKIYFIKNKEEIELNNFNNFLKEIINNTNENEQCKELSAINYLWDAINIFKKQIKLDKIKLPIKSDYEMHNSVIKVNDKNIFINKTSIIKAGVILDAEKGPIIIGKNTTIDSGAIIQGPVFIGNNSYISLGAKIRPNCYIGNDCKVGGEVSSSIINDCSNKVHDGFLGNSYVGEWVNIGAGTNVSNLKNNYSDVKFNFGNKKIENTEQMFLGSFIGDYARIGISSMLNTGTYIGLGANIFGGGFQKKHIPSFSWGESDVVDFKKFIKTCKKVKLRRQKNISISEMDFLKKLYFSK